MCRINIMLTGLIRARYNNLPSYPIPRPPTSCALSTSPIARRPSRDLEYNKTTAWPPTETWTRTSSTTARVSRRANILSSLSANGLRLRMTLK